MADKKPSRRDFLKQSTAVALAASTGDFNAAAQMILQSAAPTAAVAGIFKQAGEAFLVLDRIGHAPAIELALDFAHTLPALAAGNKAPLLHLFRQFCAEECTRSVNHGKATSTLSQIESIPGNPLGSMIRLLMSYYQAQVKAMQAIVDGAPPEKSKRSQFLVPEVSDGTDIPKNSYISLSTFLQEGSGLVTRFKGGWMDEVSALMRDKPVSNSTRQKRLEYLNGRIRQRRDRDPDLYWRRVQFLKWEKENNPVFLQAMRSLLGDLGFSPEETTKNLHQVEFNPGEFLTEYLMDKEMPLTHEEFPTSRIPCTDPQEDLQQLASTENKWVTSRLRRYLVEQLKQEPEQAEILLKELKPDLQRIQREEAEKCLDVLRKSEKKKEDVPKSYDAASYIEDDNVNIAELRKKNGMDNGENRVEKHHLIKSRLGFERAKSGSLLER